MLVNILIALLLIVTCGSFVLDDGQPGPLNGNFVLSIKNTLKLPLFFHNVTLKTTGQFTNALKYMETACDDDANFKNFSMTYFPRIITWPFPYPGVYFVSAINGVETVSGETLWEFIDHSTGQQYDGGATHYFPKAGDHVAWNLTYVKKV